MKPRRYKLTVSDARFWYVKYADQVVENANAGDDYGNAFASESRIRTWLGDRWELLEFIAGGLRGWQDLVVLKRRK
jgi:hypothetical protein